ncbi:hypothetical protein ASF28_18835 [Methylobacterium sp. Leaf99]|uniref:hypothetical protein n=1 Tax=Methylobacterium sp. Leaf99 TaxID=1736251 RepID=UPI0006F93AA2|nr:hypothetical protein [Methylobacterium sp. Leaf99]KQP04884.1 hypothetical protein ASF28_18835 [Methylobacterium sp. Leaf99]
MHSVIRSISRDVFTNVSKGTTALDTLTNALGRVRDRMLDLAATSLSESLFGKSGTSGTGLLGSLFSGAAGNSSDGSSFKGGIETLFSGGSPLPKYAGGGVTNQPSIFGEAGPEAAVPLPDGRRIPVTLSQPPANMNTKTEVHLHGAPAGTTVSQTEGANGPRIDIDMISDQMEARMAGRAAKGRGSISEAIPGALRLRG